MAGARWLGLTVVLLADAFPGSCGGRNESQLIFKVSDCACVPATVSAAVAGQAPETLSFRVCGDEQGVAVAEPGRYQVQVTQGNVVWLDGEYVVEKGKDLRITLSCPQR